MAFVRWLRHDDARHPAQRRAGRTRGLSARHSPEAIQRRWQAGYEDTVRTLARKPWETPIDPMMGVAVFDSHGAFATSPVGKAR